jgi:hypothetical protein
MRSTETAPILVAAKRAIHEAPAAAELTTDDRVWRVRLAVLLGFATIAFTFWRTLELVRSFLKHHLSTFYAKKIQCSDIPN